MRTLRASPPSRLTAGEQELLRELADSLLFAPRFDADAARRAVCGRSRSGSDGTRTRDLRRDRPAL
jgi:hypothetical protein